MYNTLKFKLFTLTIIITLCFSLVCAGTFFFINNNIKQSQASFKCPDGYTYYVGENNNKSKPLPHNCTKADDMILVCENDFILNTNKTPLHPKNCVRDLVVFPCSIPLGVNESVIHQSLTKKINTDGLNQGFKDLSGSPLEQYNYIINQLNAKSNDQMKALQELNVYNKPTQTSSIATNTSATQTSSSAPSPYDQLTADQKKGAEIAISKIQSELDNINKLKNKLNTISNKFAQVQLDDILKDGGKLGESYAQQSEEERDRQAIQDKYSEYGDLCTKKQFKDNFNVGNICNREGGIGQGVKDNYVNSGGGFGGILGLFANSGAVANSPIVIGGVPIPDKNGLVSYFNDLATAEANAAALFDLFNNDSTPYQSQLCRVHTKALKANIATRTTRFNPGCFLGIGCTSDTVNTYIDEAISQVADSCDLQAKTCLSKIKCIRTIHKCEPQNFTYPIGDFNYYIGAELKNEFGFDKSNGRSVQFEPDYENLPEDRSFLPNQATRTICPNDTDWRPFYVAARTGFQLYDTSLMRDKPLFTPFTCIKKGFDLRSEIVTIRTRSSKSCGARTEIYGDTASNDGSAFIICTPPLDSDIQVLACPGGTSVKPIGDYTNIEGNKCYKSIEPEIYVVDTDVIGESNCTPKSIKPNTLLNCVFNLSKSNFAEYTGGVDLAKRVSDSSYQAPIDSPYEVCKPIKPLPDLTTDELKTRGTTLEEYKVLQKQKLDEIYFNKITCAALSLNTNAKKYSGHFVLPEGGIVVKILNSNNSILTTSDNCKIPETLVNKVIEYQNLLICENLKIGNAFAEESKDVFVKIDDFNYVKGKLDARLGGCTEGVSDIYDCYQCTSGQVYVPGKPCFQPGVSVATKDQPVTGKPDSPAPNIPLNYSTVPNGTPAKLTYEGSKVVVNGTIVNGGFVPNKGEKIPADAKTGPSTAILEVDGKKVEIPINLSNDNKPVTTTKQTTTGNQNTTQNPTSTEKPGDPAPNIPLNDNTIPNGTPGKLIYPETNEIVNGTFIDGGFVPDQGETIPKDAATGPGIAILEIGGKKIEIPVNLSNDANAKLSTGLGATGSTPLETKIGDSPPAINLPNNNLPNGTPATFTPNGASSPITGIIKNNQFIPDPGQTVPVGSTPGLALGVLKTANSSTGVLVNTKPNSDLLKNVPFVRTGGAARN
jgi:hypothetical protein